MDRSVLAAIAKWPDVPAVYGWLGLNARGEWRLRGEPIANAAIRDFIGRNYARDERGAWFFQNGPQRVYVELEVAPWIWRVEPRGGRPQLCAHTGAPAHALRGSWLDEQGRVYLETEFGGGLVDSGDAAAVLDALRASGGEGFTAADLDAWLAGGGPRLEVDGARLGLQGRTALGRLRAADAPARLGFVRSPAPP